MATFKPEGLDGLILSMEQVAMMPDSVKEDLLNAQADVVVQAQRKKAREYGVHRTGLVISSICKGKPKKRGVDDYVIYVYPRGTRKRGGKRVRNAEIAFINEFGKRTQEARPFMQDANESCAEQTVAAGAAVFDEFLKSKNL